MSVHNILFGCDRFISSPQAPEAWPNKLIVLTALVGGGTIYSNGFFCSDKFWPIDEFIVQKCDWYQ